MSADIIPFVEAAAEVRRRRSCPLNLADVFILTSICFLPAAVVMISAMRALDLVAGGRR